MTVGEKIRKRRKELGMTMEDLGKKIGVHRSAINKYEKGITTNLKASTIVALAKALDVSPVYLLDDDPPQKNILTSRLEVRPSGRTLFEQDKATIQSGFKKLEVAQPEVKEITIDPELKSVLKLWKVSSPKAKKAAVQILRTLAKEEKP